MFRPLILALQPVGPVLPASPPSYSMMTFPAVPDLLPELKFPRYFARASKLPTVELRGDANAEKKLAVTVVSAVTATSLPTLILSAAPSSVISS